MKDDTLYVLSVLETKEDEPNHIIRVTETRDIRTWKPLFQFRSATFARSFKYLDGVFYFGLGCEADRINPETGRILRVSYKNE